MHASAGCARAVAPISAEKEKRFVERALWWFLLQVNVLRISDAPFFEQALYFFQHLPPFVLGGLSLPVASFAPVAAMSIVPHFPASAVACVPAGVAVNV